MNRSGAPVFTKGNKLAVGKGRPPKHQIIKQLEAMRDEVNKMPDIWLNAIAHREQTTLQELQIPLSQITDHVRTLAAGLLYLRERF